MAYLLEIIETQADGSEHRLVYDNPGPGPDDPLAAGTVLVDGGNADDPLAIGAGPVVG